MSRVRGAGGGRRGLLVSSYHISDMLSYLQEQGYDSHTFFGNKASQKGTSCDPCWSPPGKSAALLDQCFPKLTQVSMRGCLPLTPPQRRPETHGSFLIFRFLSPTPSTSRTEVLHVREGAVKSPTTAAELLRVLH